MAAMPAITENLFGASSYKPKGQIDSKLGMKYQDKLLIKK